MFVYINNTDRTSDVFRSSIRIEDDVREKPNKATFNLRGTRPSYYQDVKIFTGYEILSSTASAVVLDAPFRANENNLFRVGDTVYVAINESDEETAVISTISSSGGNLQLTMTAAFTNQPAASERCGKKKFAGSAVDIDDRNITTLTNIDYKITCIDYTRIFDKRLVNDTFEDVDGRYIINDFCNTVVNYNSAIDTLNYADNAAIQAEWIESGDGNNPTVDTSDLREGTSSGVFGWTFSGGSATWEATPISQNISEFTGVNSGAPSEGVLGFWYECTNFNNITDFRVRIGSSSSDYAEVTVTPTVNDWVFHDARLEDATITGTPDWTAVDYLALVVNETATSSIRIDGIRVLEIEFY